MFDIKKLGEVFGGLETLINSLDGDTGDLKKEVKGVKDAYGELLKEYIEAICETEDEQNKLYQEIRPAIHLATTAIDVVRHRESLEKGNIVIHPFCNMLGKTEKEEKDLLLEYCSDALFALMMQFDTAFKVDYEKEGGRNSDILKALQ